MGSTKKLDKIQVLLRHLNNYSPEKWVWTIIFRVQSDKYHHNFSREVSNDK
jgi:hypothetical protein